MACELADWKTLVVPVVIGISCAYTRPGGYQSGDLPGSTVARRFNAGPHRKDGEPSEPLPTVGASLLATLA